MTEPEPRILMTRCADVGVVSSVMRISLPSSSERLGALRIHAPGRIVELDSTQPEPRSIIENGVLHVGVSALEDAQRRLTIVVPVKDERRSTLRGVLTAIPGACRIVVISASKRSPIDRFELEREVISTFSSITGRSVLHLHQADASIASLVADTGFTELIEDGRIREGKGEAMLLGTMIADAAGSDAVGFVDADNYVPGAVNEYVRIYAATMTTAASPYVMNRISWLSKPKVENDRARVQPMGANHGREQPCAQRAALALPRRRHIDHHHRECW